MQELFKIIVYLLKQMLQRERPLMNSPTKVQVFVSDDIRRVELYWTKNEGVKING